MPEKVRLISDPILRQVCRPVSTVDMVFVQGLLQIMYETMTAEGGIGLAANQIGHSVQVFILRTDNGFKEYINPEILSQGDLVDFEAEACLSIPGASGRTKRFRQVKLAWLDRDGIRSEGNFTDMDAFAVQHEIDHLNGKLYIDQFGPLKRDLVLTKHKKYLRGY